MRTLGLALVALSLVALASPAAAQEQSTEASEVRHVFDTESPVWETTPGASVLLRAPADLTVCRQGLVVDRGDHRQVHMGCWPRPGLDGARLDVPSTPGFLAVRHGLDLTWIGGGAITLNPGDILQVVPEEHLAIRVVGWVVVGLAVASAVAFGVAASQHAFRNDFDPILGVAISACALFVGLALAFVGDGFQVSFVRAPAPPHE